MNDYLVRIQKKNGKNIFFETEYESAKGLEKLLKTNIRLGEIANITNIKGKEVKINQGNFKSLEVYEKSI